MVLAGESGSGTIDLGSGVLGFEPALQREDGSYIGTDLNGQLDAIGLDGTVLYQQKLSDASGSPISLTPLCATADGGIIATSTTTVTTPNQDVDPSVATTLGTLYTLDTNGNVIAQSPDPGALYSWKGSWYTPPQDSQNATMLLPEVNQDGEPLGLPLDVKAFYSWAAAYTLPLAESPLQRLALSPVELASTYAASRDGNPSHNSSYEVERKLILVWSDQEISLHSTCSTHWHPDQRDADTNRLGIPNEIASAGSVRKGVSHISSLCLYGPRDSRRYSE